MPFNLTIQHIHHLERRSYRFLKELGHGEYGSVVHAEKQTCSLPTQVALKLIENFESFQSELRVFNLLGSHPNIVAHRGSFSDQNTHVIELEYLSGQTLLDFLITNGRLEEQRARHYFAQLVSGMLHSHIVAGVAHRDIKAENLMVCGDQLLILDWGMGLQIAPNEYLFESCGSPDYAAPELYFRKPYRGSEVDVWAMGVVLYSMVTGNFPFPGADPSQIAGSICRRDYLVPSGVSPTLLDLLARMLTKDPRSRITVGEIQQHPWISQQWTVGSPRPMNSRETGIPTATAKQQKKPCKSKRHCRRAGSSSNAAMNNDPIFESSQLSIASESSLQTLSLDQLSSLENADLSAQLKHRRRRFSLQSIFQRKRTESSTKAKGV